MFAVYSEDIITSVVYYCLLKIALCWCMLSAEDSIVCIYVCFLMNISLCVLMFAVYSEDSITRVGNHCLLKIPLCVLMFAVYWRYHCVYGCLLSTADSIMCIDMSTEYSRINYEYGSLHYVYWCLLSTEYSIVLMFVVYWI